MKLREETILIHENQTLNHNTVLISMALEGGHCPHFKLVGGGGGGGHVPLVPPCFRHQCIPVRTKKMLGRLNSSLASRALILQVRKIFATDMYIVCMQVHQCREVRESMNRVFLR